MKNITLLFIFILGLSLSSFTQSKIKAETLSFKSTPAFAEIILKKTEVEAEFESLIIDYTEEYPKVKENKLALELLKKEIEKLSKLGSSQLPKLSVALGKLIVRKVELEVEVKSLLIEYNEKNPDVIRMRKKLQIFEKAISEILN